MYRKAFNKVTHQSLKVTLERFNVEGKVVNMITAMYKWQTF